MKMRGEFPTRLRSLRGSAMMSQDELAMKIGVSVDSIRRWESGTRDPRLANVYAIAEALGVSVVELLCDEEERVAEVRSAPKTPEPTQRPDQLVYEWSDGAGRTVRLLLPPTPETYAMIERKLAALTVEKE